MDIDDIIDDLEEYLRSKAHLDKCNSKTDEPDYLCYRERNDVESAKAHLQSSLNYYIDQRIKNALQYAQEQQ